jgi:hypothetical protein
METLMNNLSIQHILADGLSLSLLLGGLIFLSLYINPRLWLQDYPASIREKVTPLTPAEKQMRGVFMLLFLAAVFVPLYLSGAGIEARQGDGVSFWAVFTHVFLVFNIFNDGVGELILPPSPALPPPAREGRKVPLR